MTDVDPVDACGRLCSRLLSLLRTEVHHSVLAYDSGRDRDCPVQVETTERLSYLCEFCLRGAVTATREDRRRNGAKVR